jgi:hypothetical protein
MKLIPLTQGQVALVDDADYPIIASYKWFAARSQQGTYYAVRHPNKYKPMVIMHRVIMGCSTASMIIDHIDGNGLNNQRTNLRFATARLNGLNRFRRKPTKKNLPVGVSQSHRMTRYAAYVQIKGKSVHLGCFDTSEQASHAHYIKQQQLIVEESNGLNH